ncbi:Hg(II)-responsive transcriptional regulator [Herminiimonas fonticola]|uniref:Mercuric resistance operon regulatory protein n=1 Tax=Herminiimonas fonticola TaxID=303380 RepID=A0A4R6FZM0_9BURK|nr:Hg(II)-responsive transcriptional regulator [Herminiimonas fonticola]RBA23580.1 MerR: Hg(II)-responsive transcriptional regulator [Herminiimonas fonticola]TDN87461.1 MerR family transcriptional regulator [Herminiimonas fonticola]
MDEKNFTVGQLARTVDVNVETVRYYHRIGLLSAPERAYGSIRRYGRDALRRLRFIKRAQRLGFALEEVSSLLALDDGTHCAETKSLAEQKLALVRQKIADLATIESSLRSFIEACAHTDGSCGCPMINALAADE